MSDEKDREAEEPQSIEDDDGDEDRTPDEPESEEEEEGEVLRLGRNPSPLPGGLDLADLPNLEDAPETDRAEEDSLSEARRQMRRVQDLMGDQKALERIRASEFRREPMNILNPAMDHAAENHRRQMEREKRRDAIQARQAKALEFLCDEMEEIKTIEKDRLPVEKGRFRLQVGLSTGILLTALVTAALTVWARFF